MDHWARQPITSTTVKRPMNIDAQDPSRWLLLPTCRVDLPYTSERRGNQLINYLDENVDSR